MLSPETLQNVEDFDDIIALKLKKPKNWNWQLFTSKSSPHISLPVIRLYDYKGNLLVQTEDNGFMCQRKSWHSEYDSDKKQLQSSGKSKCGTFHSEQNYSDKRDVATSNKQEESISHPEKRQLDKNNNDFVRNSAGKIKSTDNQVPEQLSKKSQADKKNINNDGKNSFSLNGAEEILKKKNYLRKSKTDLLWKPGIQIKDEPCHRRTRSDDAYKRKMKYNDDERKKKSSAERFQKLKSSMNSQRPEIYFDVIKRTSTYNKLEKPSSKYDALSESTVQNSDVVQSTIYPRYKTRTSSAGTLIINEESFNKPNRRKRPERANTSADMTSEKISKQGRYKANDFSDENDANIIEEIFSRRRKSSLSSTTHTNYNISFPTTDDGNQSETVISHVRQRSDPLWYGNICEEQTSDVIDEERDGGSQRRKNQRTLSIHGPFKPPEEMKNTKDAHLTFSNKPSYPEQHRKKKRRKLRRQRRHSDGSTSSNGDNAEWKNRNGRETSVARGDSG